MVNVGLAAVPFCRRCNRTMRPGRGAGPVGGATVSNGDSFARQWVRSLAAECGWPAVETRHGSIGPGEDAWRELLASCTVFALGAASRALQALAATTHREAGAPNG